MANPQKENGYTAIANEIMEAIMRYRIPGEKRQILDCILRMTYGYANRKEVEISNNMVSRMTGLKRQNVVRGIAWLESKVILIRIKDDSTRTKVLKFNKNYDSWVPFERKKVRIKTDAKVRIKTDAEKAIIPLVNKTIKQIEPIYDFDLFWKHYPIKKAKDAAQRKWKKLIKDKKLPDTNFLIKAILDQKKEKDDLEKAGKFVAEWKHPATWLNGGCWKDEVQVIKKESTLPLNPLYTGPS